MKTIWWIFILVASASAANYTVQSGGGGDFTTIQACATAMSAGDTCTVFAGAYNENVTVTAGTPNNYKTLTVNPSDTVNVLNFTINSHVKINGFHIQNPSSPNSSDCLTINGNSTDFYITNNIFYACGSHAMIYAPGGFASTGNGFIQGNTFSYSCSTSGAPNTCTTMALSAGYMLIENNDISHVSDGPYLNGSHIVYRKNTFHDVYSTDCGSNSGNCHVDFMQADANVAGGSQAAQYFVIENNTVNNMVGNDMHAMGLFQAEACNGQCFNGIVRFNVVSHVGGGAIIDDNSGTVPGGANSPAWINVKSYNNSWIDVNNQHTGVGEGTNGFDHGSYGAAEINDLFYYPEALSDFNPYECQDSNNGTSKPACTGPPAFVAKNNLGWCTGSPCNLRPHTYGSGTFTDDPGNIKADPLFVNYAGNDFQLQAGSPALNAGTYLTTVAAGDPGSGTSLIVKDAGFFQDGFGIAGVNADCIAVTRVTNHVCITAVNYSTNTITLASGITRLVGDPVWLYSDSTARTVLVGNAPNIGGTFDPPPGPEPPTGLTATVQ